MPPSHSSSGDLVDQIRDWFNRLRHGGGHGVAGNSSRRGSRRPGFRSQAVPLGSYQPRAASRRRTREHGSTTGRPERAERTTYTLVFAAVLVALVIGLYFLLSWLLGSGGPFGASSQPSSVPNATPGQLPNPAPISSPPPFLVTSPSPSPSPAIGPSSQGRAHTVQAGDTLNRIAQQYGVTVDAIMQANGRTDRNQILRIREQLVIPEPAAASPTPR